jgi:hypothetical protein
MITTTILVILILYSTYIAMDCVAQYPYSNSSVINICVQDLIQHHVNMLKIRCIEFFNPQPMPWYHYKY